MIDDSTSLPGRGGAKHARNSPGTGSRPAGLKAKLVTSIKTRHTVLAFTASSHVPFGDALL